MTSAELDKFRVRFANLRGELEERRKQDRERDKAEAPRFNLFRLLGVEPDEVRTHSAFIADLLDPEGSHGQGDRTEEMKDRLIRNFWKQLKDCVQHDDRANGWEVRIRFESGKLKNWALDVFPVCGMKKRYLSVTVIEEEVTKDQKILSYGILYWWPEDRRLGKPRKEDFPAPLPGPGDEWKDEGWWVAKRVILPHVLRDRRSLIEEQHLRLPSLAKEVAKDVCELMQAERKFIEDWEPKAVSAAEAACKRED